MEKKALMPKNYSMAVSILTILSSIGALLIILYPFRIPQELVKMGLFSFCILFISILFFLQIIKSKSISFINSSLMYSLLIVAFISLLSSLISGNFLKSFIGYGFEFPASFFIVFILFLCIIVNHYFNSSQSLKFAYKFATGVGLAFALFHLISSWPGIFSENPFNLVGNWQDISIISGLTALISAMQIKSKNTSNKEKIYLYIVFIISLALLIKVGFSFAVIWAILGIISLIIIFSGFKSLHKGESSVKSFLPFIFIFIFSAVLIVFPSYPNKISKEIFIESYGNLNKTSLEVSLKSSRNILFEDPIFGPGPNLYLSSFLKNKPIESNYAKNWGIDIPYLFGSIPTLMISTGVLGIIFWLIFIFISLKKTLSDLTNRIIKEERNIFAAGFLFLLLVLILTVSNVSIFIFFAIFFCLYLISRASDENQIESDRRIDIKGSKAIISVLIILIIVLYGSYNMGIKLFSGINFALAVKDIGKEADGANIDNSIKKINKSAVLSNDDIYYQILANLSAGKMNKLISEKGLDSEEFRRQFELSFKETIEYTRKAIENNPDNYINHLLLAELAQSSVSLGAQNAYSTAKDAYIKAITLAPNNPALYLIFSKFEAANANMENSKELLEKAISIKKDFIEASIMLSQIYLTEKDSQKAKTILIESSLNLPERVDFNSYLKLGGFLYQNSLYQEAINVLIKIISIDGQHADARYFIGLSLSKLGKYNEALFQFEEIKKYNPEVPEIDRIIESLKAGRDPIPLR